MILIDINDIIAILPYYEDMLLSWLIVSWLGMANASVRQCKAVPLRRISDLRRKSEDQKTGYYQSCRWQGALRSCFAGYLIVKGVVTKKANEVEDRSANFIFPHLASLKGSGRMRNTWDSCKTLLVKLQTCHPMWTAPAWDQGSSKRWPSILLPTYFMLLFGQDISRTWAFTAVHSNTHCVYLLQLLCGEWLLLDTQTAEENASSPAYSFTRECPLMNRTSWPTWWHPYSRATSFGDAKQILYHCLLVTLLMSLQRMVS